jgi:hypothetical protein
LVEVVKAAAEVWTWASFIGNSSAQKVRSLSIGAG